MAGTAQRRRHLPGNSSSRRPPAKVDIWIIDADPLFRKGIQTLLNKSPGLSCTHAFSQCDAAVETLRTDHAPQVILIEHSRQGDEALQLIGSLSPTTCILTVLASEETAGAFDAIRAGASGTVMKNEPAKALVAQIRRALSGHVSMSGAIAQRVLKMFPKGHPTKLQYQITVRELEFLTLLAEGLGTKEIASRLCVNAHTIDTHLKNIYAKLHMHSSAGAISRVFKEHLL